MQQEKLEYSSLSVEMSILECENVIAGSGGAGVQLPGIGDGGDAFGTDLGGSPKATNYFETEDDSNPFSQY